MQLALASDEQGRKPRFRLPPCVPPFNSRMHRLFTVIWIAAFLLAITGPLLGFYYRYTAPENNSQLLLGSRAGFAVSPQDATRIRFPVGNEGKAAGISHGDRIVAIYGLPLPKVMPVTEDALAEHQDDPAYIAMGNLLFGTDASEVPITLRARDGSTREVVVRTGEDHIETAAHRLGVTVKMLSFVDLLHVISYPFLLWAAWILHRRNARDAVSSILSLAVLLTIGAEQPSSVFLANVGVPRWLNVALYDLGNVLLLTGILLFPHGILSWRKVALIASLPILMFLQGKAYQTIFVAFMVIAVLTLIRCLRNTASSEQRQQIRWALLGISGYSVLRCVSIIADYMKWSATSFGQQLLIEILAGVAFALAVLMLQLGLLVALLRFRLYDAEAVISRSANFALITIGIGGIFAGANEAVKVFVQGLYGDTASQTPGIFAAAVATVAVTPLYEKIQHWSEKRFQHNLFILRDDLPEVVRDMRQTASLQELIQEVLTRVERGVRCIRTAAIIDGKVFSTLGVSKGEVEAWMSSEYGESCAEDDCVPKDKFFPVRVALVPSSEDEAPIGFILVGPRPDGSIIGKEEQKALSGVSEAIARAVRNVAKREAREKQVTDAIEAANRRLDELEALFSQPSRTGTKSQRPA